MIGRLNGLTRWIQQGPASGSGEARGGNDQHASGAISIATNSSSSLDGFDGTQ